MAIVIAVIAAGAAVGSWRSAQGSNAIARRANETSERALAIESSRQHDEQTPEFEVSISARDTATNHADLTVKLARPVRLDEVVIRVLDEAHVDHWANGLPDGVTRQEADLFVWGPWQFNTGARQQVADTRTSLPRRYSRVDGTDGESFDLVKTRPGRWMGDLTQQSWERDRANVVRLSFECRVEGQEPWHLSYEITVRPPPRIIVR